MDHASDHFHIPGYKIMEGPLRGGMALVYIAQQENTRRKVAIKLIQPRLSGVDNMAQYAKRFRREAVFQANLVSPYIATLYELDLYNDQPYIVMEYLPGGGLDKKIREARQHPYTVHDALRITRQVAMALHAAHEKGVIHRDVKPANILFRNNGDAVLTDFGIAKAINDAGIAEDITQTVSFALGTPRYMSPEQLRGERDTGFGVSSDLYSLGATLFHLITGRPPFLADTYMGVAELHFVAPVPRLPRELAPLDELIQKTLAKRPQQRYASALALVEQIDLLERRLQQKDAGFLQLKLPLNNVVDHEGDTRVDAASVDFPAPRRRWGIPAALATFAVSSLAGVLIFQQLEFKPSEEDLQGRGANTSIAVTDAVPAPVENGSSSALSVNAANEKPSTNTQIESAGVTQADPPPSVELLRNHSAPTSAGVRNVNSRWSSSARRHTPESRNAADTRINSDNHNSLEAASSAIRSASKTPAEESSSSSPGLTVTPVSLAPSEPAVVAPVPASTASFQQATTMQASELSSAGKTAVGKVEKTEAPSEQQAHSSPPESEKPAHPTVPLTAPIVF